MPDLFEPASHFAVTAAWIAGVVAIAYEAGLGLSWLVGALEGAARCCATSRG